jgi:hypothetical protein
MCAERPGQNSPRLDAVLTALQGRVVSFAPGTIIGAGVYLQTGQVLPALLLACLVGRPTVAIQEVVAGWIELLAPPKRWRRPRRRGG